MIELIQGFNVGSGEPIDKRLIISSTEVEVGLPTQRAQAMPDMYMALCEDDGLYYVYNKATNTYTRASDFINSLDITYYNEEEPTNKDLLVEGTGGKFNNYKKAHLDANEIVKKSGLTIHFFNNPEEEYKLFAQLKDTNGEIISESEMIDIPMEDALKNIALSDDKTKIVATAISGETHEIAFSELYNKFDLVNQTDLANAITKEETDLAAEAATRLEEDTKLSNRVSVFEEDGSHDVAAFEVKEAKDVEDLTKLANDLRNAEFERATTVEASIREDLVNEINDRSLAVSTENTRALAAESSLNNAINSEASTARSAEATLTTNLSNEISRATQAEATLQSNIDKEATRAKATELENLNKINAEQIRAEAKEAELTTLISNESSTARAAELKLTTDLSDEVVRAKAAELALTNSLNAEVSRANDKEGELLTKINSEETRAKDSESTLTTSITNEKSRAIARENEIETNAATATEAEKVRAVAKENEIATNLTTEASTARANETTISSNLSDEIARAKAAEKVLTDNLAAEVTRSTAKDNELNQKISDEILRAKEAELKLTTDLNAEVTRAAAKEDNIVSDLASEVTRASEAETTLTSTLNSEITRAKAAEKVNADNLTSEASTARAAELKLTNDLASESTRAQRAESTLTSDLSAEVTNRTTADNTLQEAINNEAAIARAKEQANATGIADNKQRIDSFYASVMTGASPTNKITTEEFVNSTVATYTATFRGTYTVLAELLALRPDVNDYAYYDHTVNENRVFDRYKYGVDIDPDTGTCWKYEYTLNNSSFTNAQWLAINSGATANRLTKIESDINTVTEAITTEITSRSTAISNEASTRSEADTALSGRITTIENDYLVAADKTELKGLITSEASTARAAEQSNVNSILAEKTRAEGAEETLTNNLGNEVTRATAVEGEINTSLINHKNDKNNPHEVTKAQVGLGNVDNTSDINKPVSTATQTELNKKVDKVEGKSLLADTEITRLGTLANYDDTEVRNLIAGKQDTLTQQDKQAIADLKDISSKQDVISDLETIRSGAALGATSIQSLAEYRKAADQDAIHDSTKQDLLTETNKLDYSLLDNTPTIPTNVSELNNDSNFITSSYHDSTKQDTLTAGQKSAVDSGINATLTAALRMYYNGSASVPYASNFSTSSGTIKDTFAKKLNVSDYVIPSAPTDDGTYILKCIVSNGEATYSWVAE